MKASEITGKKVLVIGTGLSGVGSVRLLHQVDAVPVMLEENTKVTREDIVKKLNEEDKENTEIIIGEISDEVLNELVLVHFCPSFPKCTLSRYTHIKA